MCKVEVIGNLDCLVEVEDFFNYGTAIVGMGCPVDISTFHHHKELVGRHFCEVVECSLSDLGQSECAGHAVDGVATLVAVETLLGSEEHHFLRGFVDFIDTVCHLIAVFGEGGEQVGFFSFLVFKSAQVATGEEVVSASSHVHSYLVVHAAIGHMGVERAGGSVIGSDGGGYCNTIAVFFERFGNAIHRDCVGTHSEHIVSCLMPCRECGSCRRRVGNRAAVTVGHGERCHRELHHEDGVGVAEHGAVVGFGAHNVSHTHSIADEIEYILWSSCP